jgi:predicted PhzF superfamily epimerase YddE/YHI9
VLSQGRFAGRPSRLSVQVDRVDGTIASVKGGGGGVFVGRGTLDVLPELEA